MRALIKWRDAGLVTGIPRHLTITDKNRHICEACARAKATRHPMSKSSFRSKKMNKPSSARHNPRRTKVEPAVLNKVADIFDEESPSKDLKFLRKLATAEPLHKTIREISTDIKGPFEIKSRHGSAYYHGFIESDSKYHCAYFLKNRSEAL